MTGGVRLAALNIERAWHSGCKQCRRRTTSTLGRENGALLSRVHCLLVPMSAGTRHLASAVVMHGGDKET